jgi:drug/metabolite transporter (DMT)-like permease
MLGVAALGWGGSTTLSAYALRQLSAADLLVLELLVGGAIIWCFALLDGRRRLRDRRWRTWGLLGLFEPGLTYLLANEGLRHESAATASLLFSMEAVLVVGLAALFLGERPGRRVVGPLAIGVLGAILVGAGGSTGQDSLTGHLLILGATFAASVYAVMARATVSDAPVLVVTAYQLLAATVIAVPLALIEHASSAALLPSADVGHWLAGAGSGIVGVGLPFVFYNRAIRAVQASVAAVLLNCIPLIGLVTAVLALGDRPGPVELIGGALILVGLLFLARSEASSTRAEPAV